MNRKWSVLAFVVVSLLSAAARATVPQSFTVQGVLRDKAGALQSTTATVVVNFFAAATPSPGEKPLNATPITLTGVGVTNGLFTINVPLSSDLTNTFGNPAVWLEMTVNSDTFPRQQVTPDVYSLFCGTADLANSLAAPLSTATWQTPTLATGWTNYGNGYNDPGFYKDALGWVHLKGMIKGPAATSTMFTLPAGYLPAQRYLTMTWGASAGNYAFARVDVDTAGNVMVIPTTVAVTNWDWVSLDMVYFKSQ
jgi:hypothetical protein